MKSLMLVLAVLVLSQPAFASDEASEANPNQGITFSVGLDEALTYPSDLIALPDEHTTIVPPKHHSHPYLFFAASLREGGKAGTVVLETTDLRNFSFAVGYDSPVMSPPIDFTTCKPYYDPEFDLNYAGQGSVLQDPTLPPGNLIMIYEAENHCPGGVWQKPFYATVGFARSSDNGKTWPDPVDSEFGGRDRYPVLKGYAPEPDTPEQSPAFMGDALPSAFVDKHNEQDHYLYVTYNFTGPGGDGFIRVARAKLREDRDERDEEHRLSFSKWYNGAFSEPGIGGLDSGVLPSRGCVGTQNMAQITHNDALGLYVMTFVCVSLRHDPPPTGPLQPYQAAWFFSTATSLDLQNWTDPQMIENSQFPVTQCPGLGGNAFDGWYPSFMSPGSAAGHTSDTGHVFFLSGCDGGLNRAFLSRTFAIKGPTPSRKDGDREAPGE